VTDSIPILRLLVWLGAAFVVPAGVWIGVYFLTHRGRPKNLAVGWLGGAAIGAGAAGLYLAGVGLWLLARRLGVERLGQLDLRFGRPWLLLAALVAVPMVALAWRNLAAVGRGRRVLAVVLRALVVLVLAVLLADPLLARRNDRVSLVAVLDRSLSVPGPLQEQAREYLRQALRRRQTADRLSVINVAEDAVIEQLDGPRMAIREREMSLRGEQTDLAAGVQLGMAVAGPESAARFLLVSDGNETEGDLREAARIAAANGIPIDVLPLTYENEREVFLKRLVAPPNAAGGQTISLRFVLASAAATRGRLHLSLNGAPLDLDPAGDGVAAPVALKPGTNVKTISLPVGTRGLHRFEATFVPDDPADDAFAQNNRASAMTHVAGPGHILVVDPDGKAGAALAEALRESGIDLEHVRPDAFPRSLPEMLDTDAVVLANTSASAFTEGQQDLMCHFVRELGGGLIMIGGPESFGAGGWIGSPVAEVLPVDLDPPQKRQLPQGTLVLVIDRSGSMSGQKLLLCKRAAVAALYALSRLDYIGVVMFDTEAEWVIPLQKAEDKERIGREIRGVPQGGGTDMYPAMQEARTALAGRKGIRHVILLTDGMTAGPDCRPLAVAMKEDGITISTVSAGRDADLRLLDYIARTAGGRFYHIVNPKVLPQVFVKEAQTIRRALINEEDFMPKIVGGLSELVRGMRTAPQLNGYVVTAPKGGAAELIMTGPEDDPVLAAGQAGVGRSVAFTSSADTRWAAQWVAWGGFVRFWEQAVRWAAKSRQPGECVVFADVQGRDVTITAEALDSEGEFVQYTGLTGRVVTPGMDAEELGLVQVGPGQYRARFRAAESGSYLVNLRYRKAGGGGGMVQTVVSIPYAAEFNDLSDNAGLLDEVARQTGGRVLTGPPEEAELFSRAGLQFPQTPLPIAQALMGAWLVLFLLDVASRRLAVDVGAAARRADAWLRGLGRARRGEEDAHLARLRKRTQKVRRQIGGRGAVREAARRWDAPADAAAEMPDERERKEEAAEVAARSAPPEKEESQSPGPSTGESHLDRLLKARRRARTRAEDEDD
jgi:uncharacterized membrane protein